MTAKTKVLAGGVVVLAAALLYWQFGRGNTKGDGGSSGKAVGSASSTTSGNGSGESRADTTPASLTGTTRARGATIGAVVQLSPLDEDSRVEPQVSVAGDDGAFSFEDIEPGRYQVSAAHTGYLPALSGELELRAGASESVDLELEVGGSPVEGLISDITGGPVANAFVRLTPVAGILSTRPGRAFSAVTGAEGKFTATAADGVYVLSAHHPDYVTGRRRIELRGGNRDLTLALVPGGVIEGTVRFRKTDAPAAGAIVRYRRETVSRGFGGAMRQFRDGGQTRTDARGTFRITGAGAGLLSLTATTDSSMSTDDIAVPLGIGENRSGVDIYLDDAFHISGVVVDKKGLPVASATVMASGGDESTGERSAADGTFRLGPLPSATYNVSASAGGGFMGLDEGTRVVVANKDVTDLRLETDAAVSIAGRVDPASDAEISVAFDAEAAPGSMPAFLGSTSTDAAGTFEMGPVRPGTKVPLRAVSADGRLGELTVSVPEGGASGVVISLEEAASINGRVTDQSGRPVPGARVNVVAHRKGVRRTVMINGTEVSARRAVTSPDGSFVVAGLEGGDYRISVKSDTGETLLWAKPASKAMPTAPVEITVAEREQKTGVSLVVEALDGEIRGTVLDPDGKPAADVFVKATPSISFDRGPRRGEPGGADGPRRRPAPRGDGGDEADVETSDVMMVMQTDGDGVGGGGALFTRELPPVVTGADGTFVIGGLRRGEYDLVAEGRGGTERAFALKVKTGATTRIKLEPLTSLEGVVTVNGEPVDDFRISLSGPTMLSRSYRDEAGAFTVRRLDPGTYTLSAQAEEGEATVPVTVVAGEPTRIEVKLQGQVKIRGHLLDKEGEPIAGALMLLVPPSPDGGMEIRMDSSQMPPRTADDGLFIIKTLPGEFILIGIQPGKGPVHQQPVTVTGDADLGKITASGGMGGQSPPPE